MSSFLDSTGLDRLATKLKAYFMKKPTTAVGNSSTPVYVDDNGIVQACDVDYTNHGTVANFDTLFAAIKAGPHVSHGAFIISTPYTLNDVTIRANSWYTYRWTVTAGNGNYGILDIVRGTGTNTTYLERYMLLVDSGLPRILWQIPSTAGFGTSGQYLKSMGADKAPVWDDTSNLTVGGAKYLSVSTIDKNNQTAKIWKKIATSKLFTSYDRSELTFIISAQGYTNEANFYGIVSTAVHTGGSGSYGEARIDKYIFRNVSGVELLRIGSTNQYEIWVNAPFQDTSTDVVPLHTYNWTVNYTVDRNSQLTAEEYTTYKQTHPKVGIENNYNVVKSIGQVGSPSNPVYVNSTGSVAACTDIGKEFWIEGTGASAMYKTIGSIEFNDNGYFSQLSMEIGPLGTPWSADSQASKILVKLSCYGSNYKLNVLAINYSDITSRCSFDTYKADNAVYIVVKITNYGAGAYAKVVSHGERSWTAGVSYSGGTAPATLDGGTKVTYKYAKINTTP